MEMTRSEYNRAYYQKNRESILAKKRKARSNPAQLTLINFDSEGLSKTPKKRKTKKVCLQDLFAVSFLSLLVGAMSYFLVRESVAFYELSDSDNVNPWLKAILVEGLLVGLMLTKAKTVAGRVFTKLLAVLMVIYATWSFSSHIFSQKLSGIESSRIQQEFILDTKEAIARNDILIAKWQEKGWIGAVRQLNEKNMELRKRFDEEIRSFRKSGVKVKEAEMSNLWALLVFRVLIQLGNLFFVNRLGDFLHRFKRR